MKYLVRRIARALLLMIGVSSLCFLLTQIAPGKFFDELRLNPQISPETIAGLNSRYGLDQPVVLRYGRWLGAVAHGDFGYSIAYNSPVASLLWTRLGNTLLLTTTAMILIWVIALPLGVVAAANRAVDKTLTGVSSLLISVPEIVIAIGLLAVVVRGRMLPVGGMHSLGFEELSSGDSLKDLMLHMIMPLSILVLAGLPVIFRHVRSSVLEVLDAPYVQAARGLGIGPIRLLFRHVLPVAANPAISLFGFSLAALLSGSLLVEVITGWPGLGPLILEATLSRDLFVVVGGAMLSALFMIGGNLVADVMLLACDPRIRTEAQG
ncbi:MAG TPA: ABC transporter permease [Terriglobales bacterium]|nr:ABC transporter permease [Terriglobales bacterium]